MFYVSCVLQVEQWSTDSEERQMWLQRTAWLQEELVTAVAQICRQVRM